MFKLVRERTAWWPVVWQGVAEDGEAVENRIELKFRIVGRKEFTDIFGDAISGGEDERVGEDVLAKDMALARRLVLEDWRGVGDEKGAALPFSWDGLAQLMDAPNFGQAFGLAYMRLFQAMPEIREKNSGASPASGPATEAPAATQAPSQTS